MREPFDHERPEPSATTTVRRGLRRQRVRRRRRVLLAVGGVLALLVLALIAWYEIESHPFGSQGSSVIVTVSKGESTSAVAGRLETQGVVGSGLALKLYFLIHGTPRLEPGSYVVHQNSSFSALRSVLNGSPNLLTVTVQPGFTVSEVARQLPAGGLGEQFRRAAQGGAVSSPFQAPGVTSLEGLLGVGSYHVLPGETGSQLLIAMVQRFEDQAAAAGLTPARAAALGATPYEVITVASIVQKEGYIEKNMPQVARVIYNRLSTGTPLQMDATVLFPLGQDGGPVTAGELRQDTPYNTYLHAGLTPTPICFPSAAALEAAVSPPPGPWRYFVVVERDGTEAFATTFSEQLVNEQLAKSRGLG